MIDTSNIDSYIEEYVEKKEYIEDTKQKVQMKGQYDLINEFIEVLKDIKKDLER